MKSLKKQFRIFALIIFLSCLQYLLFARPRQRELYYDTSVFLVAGQSNAVGQGDSTTAAQNCGPLAFEYKYLSHSVQPLKDPVGENVLGFEKAHTGSAWPAFASRFVMNTAKRLIIVPAARSGSSCASNAELKPYGSWSDSGSLFINAILKTTSALKLTKTQLTGIIWSQGERDANAINEGSITVDEYQKSLIEIIKKFRTAFKAVTPFFIIETGYFSGHQQSGFDSVRSVQERVAAQLPKVYIVYEKTNLFTAADKLPDGIHYNQKKLNEIGTSVADHITQIMKQSGQ